MTAARQHYERLLGSVYRWSVAAHGDPHGGAQAMLAKLGVLDGESYLDLGAGFGAHAVPLARAEKQVTAVDFEPQLLAQLTRTAADEGLRVETHAGDFLDFLAGAEGRTWDVIACLGDTLTHLDSAEDVHRLLQLVSSRLDSGGRFVVGYRDSTGMQLEGTERFIPVAYDANRTMHCLLEPIDGRHLRVTDIITEVEDEGPRTRISDYVKLRIARDELVAWAAAAGMTVEHEHVARGMTHLVFRATRPQGS